MSNKSKLTRDTIFKVRINSAIKAEFEKRAKRRGWSMTDYFYWLLIQDLKKKEEAVTEAA